MTESIDNLQDIIDSRDVIARIEELEGDQEALQEAVTEAREVLDDAKHQCYDNVEMIQEDNRLAVSEAQEALEEAQQSLEDWNGSCDAEELKALKALAEEAESSPDWNHGETLIRDTYFEDYARELAEDIGAISRDMDWPCNCIDWEEAADELKQDYSSVDFDGVDYWIRA
jgi:uncharacterized protein (UPF0335 family)